MNARTAMVSTYPPTACGLATFAQSLAGGLQAHGRAVEVVRVVDVPELPAPPGVVRHWVRERPGRPRLRPGDELVVLAAVLNRYDVVLLQHEYGIFGGPDGADLLDLLDLLTVPVVSVLHTVLHQPTPSQQAILEDVIRMSAAVVTMTRTARTRAVEGYGADPVRVHVIPHGAAEDLVAAAAPTVRSEAPDRPPLILTWGLIGPGKGIEWAIDALAGLGDLPNPPVYLVAGRTHPQVLERDGEAYRESLIRRAERLGVADRVVFDDRYLDAASLHALVRGAAVVLLPYDSREQVTSGVLTEAVAAGRPVVSTRFPHAVELLGDGAGLLVDRADPAGITAALRRLLTEPGLAADLARRAGHLADGLSWSAVGSRYLALCDAVAAQARTRRSGAHRAGAHRADPAVVDVRDERVVVA
jgi:glycosyltransferase involved in cell wall biosynthesis